MEKLSNFHFNLGIPQLFSEWKKLFTLNHLGADIIAGSTVAFVAIPLSLAIALASNVSPGTGLITAIVAGIVCALFGGTPLSVSGPAAAMSVIIADVVQRYGVPPLIFICLLTGVLQLISGVLGIGRLARYVPLPVIAGFTSGIGMIILIGQLPRAFGLAPPAESRVFEVIKHISQYLHEINGTCIFIVIITIACIRLLPKVFPRIPPILPAVVLATLLVYFFKLSDVPLIGEIPRSLPMPRMPQNPGMPFNDLMLNTFVIFFLASLETLLSSSAVDKLSHGKKKHDSNQELIGQGLGNMAVSFFAGIPVTGVIARSVINVRAGAKTRRSSIIHSLILLFTVYVAAPLISLIPIAALAGVLFNIAIGMLDYREFHRIWITTRSEAAIYLITFATIVFVDLLAGVQAGIIAAAIIVLIRATKTQLKISTSAKDGVVRIAFSGALTFLSTGVVDNLQKKLSAHGGQITVLDLSSIRNVDSSGATAVVDLFHFCKDQNIKFYIQGLPRRFESLIRLAGGDELLDKYYLISEQQLKEKEYDKAPLSSYGRLLHGVQRFYAERKLQDNRLLEYISKRQNPHTLFIACSDSRVIPSAITSSDPGELFIIRNIGNFIPPYEANSEHSESAAIQFALSSFDITDIVICGHANCGAIKASMQEDETALKGALRYWIGRIKNQLMPKQDQTVGEMSKLNVVNQLNTLKQYPIVRERLENETLQLHGWFFEFNSGRVYEWSEAANKFKFISENQDSTVH